MSDLYDAGQSPLRVAHRHSSERDWLYRICLIAAPLALVGAVTTETFSIFWSGPAPLPPAAVPIQPPKPAAPPSPPAPVQPAPTVDFEALRDRAITDTTAQDDLRSRAFSGNAEAQFWLATLYDPSLPSVRFPKDASVAADWYEKSAAQSYAWAQNHLGWLYENGLGRPKDYAQAAVWYRKAADQGYDVAQVNIGYFCQLGRGVNQDYGEAMRWYRMAADQGNAIAQNDIGGLYGQGLGVTPDYAEAMRWYRMAADQGNDLAEYNIGNLYANGQGVPRDLGQARQWWRKAAAAGNDDVRKALARYGG